MASTILIACILIGIPVLFIFLFSLVHKRVKQKALAKQNAGLEELISANNLTINEKEKLEHYLIAIDSTNAKLVYLNAGSTKGDIKLVDLHKIKTARIDVEENSIYEDRKGKPVFVEKQVVKLQLTLTKKDADQPAALLPFYQYQDGLVDHNMLKQRVEYWRDNINNFLKENRA